jgi:hypothetical protein
MLTVTEKKVEKNLDTASRFFYVAKPGRKSWQSASRIWCCLVGSSTAETEFSGY